MNLLLPETCIQVRCVNSWMYWAPSGVARTYPQPDSGFEVTAEPPVGQEYVLAVATVKRITPAELGISLEQGPIAVVESEDAPDLAARLSKRFLSTAPSERASAHFYQRVVGRSETAEYAAVDIVDYFTTRSRSIRRPKLDLHVRFMTGSHELDVPARENLVAVAEALLDSRMQAMRFMVSGHTDDIGELDYNNALSQRRAQSVIRYLTEQQNIDPERLKASYFGETRPLESNDSPAGRRVNRRVEFQLIR